MTTTNYAALANGGKLTVDDVNNGDVEKLLTDEYGGQYGRFSLLYWTSETCPSQVLERLLERTKRDVDTRTYVSAYR
jgi:hypothetical protein